MNKVVSLAEARNAKRKAEKKSSKMRVMCREGHHKWVLQKDAPFDVNTGKLVTTWQCSNCGKKKTELK